MTDAPTVNHALAAWIIADAEQRAAAGAKVWDGLQAETNLPQLRQSFAAATRQFDPVTKKWRQPLAPLLAPAKPIGLMLHLAGQWQRVGIDDDRQSEPVKWDRAAEVIRQTKADREYLAQCRNETGDAAGPKYERQKRERAELLAQSHELARRLESAGVSAYRKDGAGLWVWWVCSQQAEQLPQFRRICFLPTVSAQVRAGKLAALEFFDSRNPFCRFWTFTSGPRVPVADLRARVEWLHGKLNELNQWLRKNWQVEIIFRSTELGTIEFDDRGNTLGDKAAGRLEFDRDGAPLFHPHAHCVMQSLRGFIAPAEWCQMFAQIWEFWRDDQGRQLNWDGGHKGKSGVIRNARECAKYVTKPGDMLKLSPADLAKTEAALHGLHLVQPLGELKREIAARRAAGKVLVRVPTPEGTIWAERDDWNKFAHESDSEKENRANLQDAQRMALETAAAARVTPPIAPREVLQQKAWTRIFARLAPAIGPHGVKEPRVIVGGSMFHRPTVETHPLVVRLWQQTVQSFEAGIAADKMTVMGALWRQSDRISVHTGTPTATDACPDPGLDPPETWETAFPVEIAAHFAK